MSEELPVVMGAVPVEDPHNDIIPAPGSIKAPCSICGREVWLGLKQQEYIGQVWIACYPCLIKAGMTKGFLAENKGKLGDLRGPTATIKPKNQDN
jgi:hypothetical protein